jgi:hypothetical protein
MQDGAYPGFCTMDEYHTPDRYVQRIIREKKVVLADLFGDTWKE